MAKYSERLRSFVLNEIYAIVLLVANLIAVTSMSFLYDLIRTEADTETLADVFAAGVGWLNLLTFVIPITLGSIYYRSMRRPHEVKEPSPQEKRLLLNAPLIMSLVGMTGWLTAIVILFLGALINGVSLRLDTVIRYALDMLFAGSMVFVITYFFWS